MTGDSIGVLACRLIAPTGFGKPDADRRAGAADFSSGLDRRPAVENFDAEGLGSMVDAADIGLCHSYLWKSQDVKSGKVGTASSAKSGRQVRKSHDVKLGNLGTSSQANLGRQLIRRNRMILDEKKNSV
jgi:hypothetical protein